MEERDRLSVNDKEFSVFVTVRKNLIIKLNNDLKVTDKY